MDIGGNNRCISNRRKGHLQKGHGIVAATASIPSKYQTIVIKNNEKTGFNSGATRFSSNFQDESPGPCNYNIIQTDKTSTSFSKKGYGGFVSKAQRFPEFLKDFNVGPGEYSPSIKPSHDFNKASCTSNFHSPIAVEKHTKYNTPAPNQYNVPNKFTGRHSYQNNVAARAAFMSKTKRDFVFHKSAAPAPGTYDVSDKLIRSNARAVQAPFNSTLKRCPSLPKSILENPGPANYYPYEVQPCSKKEVYRRKHFLCISAPAVPPPPRPVSPGPGQYNLVNYGGPEKSKISSSMFVSTTERWDGGKRRGAGPGPGTYSLSTTPKQSFIFNAAQRWI